jgi:toxin-antitoxin system PIN domain toxin
VIAVDINILVYAHRKSLPRHGWALAWIKHLAEGNLPWGLPVFCLGEFLRVVTHPRVLDPPSRMDQACSALEGLLQSPTLRVLNPGPRYPELFMEAVRSADARGNMVFDAQIAAVCREHRASRLLTVDRDFTRFPGIHLIPTEEIPSRP